MPERQVAPYGSWRSPISADALAAAVVGLGQIEVDGGDIYWVESRPIERGRCVVVRRSADGRIEDVTPAPFSARTRVHEYGGGAFAVTGGVVFFSDYGDHRLYRQDPGREPRPITPEGLRRYADLELDPARERLICVREDHSVPGREAMNCLVSVDLEGRDEPSVLVSGNDFYSSPTLSPDGKWLAFLTWNHPNMPWDGCELWIAGVEPDGRLGALSRIAGGLEESIFQPQWSPSGLLHFVSDRSGWWNLYRWVDGRAAPLLPSPLAAEFGVPQWMFRQSQYAFASADRIVCAYVERATAHLAILDAAAGRLEPIDTPFTVIRYVHAAGDQVAFLAGSPGDHTAVVALDLAARTTQVVRRASTLTIDAAYVSAAQAIELPTENGLTAHAFFYPPANGDYEAPAGELPPLIVRSHGGPTGNVTTALNPGLQYWTSRGFAVVEVNYGGSTGYGRAYRERLNGQWGVVDVDDCVNAALFLAGQGLVDGERLIVTGGSAGGYTTLCALVFTDAFKAGASYFGVADLESMARTTHKYESRYLDRLVGPYPERADLYRGRSPVRFADRITCPVILFQGLDDHVVPPSQAEQIVAALREKGLPFAYLAFDEEGHGFVRAENIRRSIEAELCFYSQVFGFPVPDVAEFVEIENLPDTTGGP